VKAGHARADSSMELLGGRLIKGHNILVMAIRKIFFANMPDEIIVWKIFTLH
jgi:hypothetical protein